MFTQDIGKQRPIRCFVLAVFTFCCLIGRAYAESSSVYIIQKPGSGIKLASSDGQYQFELGGRLMVDFANYQQDKVELGDGTELRRARIEVEGAAFDWAYEFGFDLADEDGAAEVKDAYLSYQGWQQMALHIGQFKQAFSLEELTSSKYITFMERALPNSFAPGRSLGIGLQTYGQQFMVAAGVFGAAYDEDEKNEGDESTSTTARIAYAPWHDKRSAFHLGISSNYFNPSNSPGSTASVDFKSRPESHVTDVKYLDTGDISNVDHVVKYGLEFAWVNGPFSIQGEHISTSVERNSGQTALQFQGWYVFASWFVTGESRAYSMKKGAFGRTKPTSPGGAWELAYRVSSLDLNDQDIKGGDATQHTFGLNWYKNAHTRFMLNLIKVENDKDANANGDVTGNDSPAIMQFRAQVDF